MITKKTLKNEISELRKKVLELYIRVDMMETAVYKSAKTTKTTKTTKKKASK